jgi:hypothetical protein
VAGSRVVYDAAPFFSEVLADEDLDATEMAR